MKKVFTLGLCAVAALSAFAYRNYDIPAGIDLLTKQPSTNITEQDGVYTLEFTGTFGQNRNPDGPSTYTEYEVYTTGTDMVLLNGCVYNLEFDYQCAELIDGAAVLYCTNNNWGIYNPVFPATSGDEWGHGAFYLGDRILNGFGTALNQKLRLHFRTSNRTNDKLETYGKPLTVKVKNLRFVPVQKQSPTSNDILHVDINEEDVNKPNDLAYTKWKKNSEGELTLRWEGDFAQNIEYTCWTSPLEHPMLENVDYNFVFEYKGPALNCVQVLYWAKVLVPGFLLGNNIDQPDIAPIPESNEWTTIRIPITRRAEANNWGRFVESVLRIGFNDHSYVDTDPKGANYGKPLEVHVRNLRFEPTNAPATEPVPIDLDFTAIGRHEGEPLPIQADGSYDINFYGQFPQEVEYEAYTSPLVEDLPKNELYYLTFSYQANDIIDELVARYWDGTKAYPIIGDSPSCTLPATSQWTQVYLPLSNRGDCDWGKAGQYMRIHFYNHDRTNKDEDIVESTPASRRNGKYGTPINVKVKDLKLVPGTQLVESSNMTPTGIENVVVDNAAEEEVIFNGEPEYYNIQGQRIMNPEKGFYIVRRGNKVSKVILR